MHCCCPLLPLLPLQGWRVTAEVVAVLEPSRRRESVVGEPVAVCRRLLPSPAASQMHIVCMLLPSARHPITPCRLAVFLTSRLLSFSSGPHFWPPSS